MADKKWQEWRCCRCGKHVTKRIGQIPSPIGCTDTSKKRIHMWLKIGAPY